MKRHAGATNLCRACGWYGRAADGEYVERDGERVWFCADCYSPVIVTGR